MMRVHEAVNRQPRREWDWQAAAYFMTRPVAEHWPAAPLPAQGFGLQVIYIAF